MKKFNYLILRQFDYHVQNIYDGKRQVLINENVKETLEWQDLTGNIKLVNHYLNEIIRVFERLSYYIIDDFLTDTRSYYSTKIAVACLAFLSPQQNEVIYIEAPVKHNHHNCVLTLSSIYHHEFYEIVCRFSILVLYQPISEHLDLAYLDRLIGIPVTKQLNLQSLGSDIQFISSDFFEIKSIQDTLQNQPVVLFFNSKSRLRVWRKKLYSFKKTQQQLSSHPIQFTFLIKLMIFLICHFHH